MGTMTAAIFQTKATAMGRMLARVKCRTARRANRGRTVGTLQLDPLPSQPIQVRRLIEIAPITAELVDAHIVRNH